jgi:HEAT repeat protein
MTVLRGVELMLDTPQPILQDARLRLAGSSFVLMEFPFMSVPPRSAAVISEIRNAGVLPIIAHPELQSQIMQQLITGGSPYGFELAKQALTSADTRDAYRAISSLEQASGPQAFELLALGARSRDSQVRAEAIASLGATGDKRAVDMLGEGLRDTDVNVRYAAARTLGAMGTDKARDLIVGLSRSGDVEDRRAAVSNMRQTDSKSSPAEKTEPSAVRITARSACSRSSRSKVRSTSSMNESFCTFALPAPTMRTTATWSWTSIGNAMAHEDTRLSCFSPASG